MMIKKKGLTLVETMFSVGIASVAIMGVYSSMADFAKARTYKDAVLDVEIVMKAFDERIDIDGYSTSGWSDTKWNNTDDVLKKLFKNEFHSSTAKKCKGTWIPQYTSNPKINLIPCDFWETKRPYDLELSAELVTDSTGFISQAILYLEADGLLTAQEGFKDIKRVLNTLKGKNNETKNGFLFYDFQSKSTKDYLTSIECMDKFNDCRIKAVYNRLGDSEGLYLDGSNSMVGTHINFIETNASAPLQCVRWIKDSTGVWSLAPSKKDCGIGVYNDTGHPVVVETSADNGTFENVVLDKQCPMYTWNSSSKLLEDTGVLTPCGMITDGSETYQVVQNTHATEFLTDQAFIEKLEADDLEVDDIVSEEVSTKYMVVKNKLIVSAKTEVTDLTIDSSSFFSGKMKIHQALTVLNGIDFQGSVDVDKTMVANKKLKTEDIDTKSSNITYLESSTIMTAGTLKADNYELDGVFSENQSCASNGSLSRDSSGLVLNCVNGRWLSFNDASLIGTIVSWPSNSIPSGWVECKGQSTSPYPALRSVIGSYIPDLRGRFVRGYQSNNGKAHSFYQEVVDYGRGFNSDQDDKYRKHSHLERAFSGDEDDKGGTDGANESHQWLWTDPTGGSETRPENIGYKFIIKVE